MHLWRRGVVVITTAKLHSSKPELRLCAGSNPVRGVSEIHDGEDLWQWSRLEIRLNAFRRSTIPQKQFIIIIIIHLILMLPNFPPHSQAPQYSTSFSCSPIFHLILMLPNVPPHSHAPQNILPHSHAPQNIPPHSQAPQSSISISCSPIFHLIFMLPNIPPNSHASQCSTTFSCSPMFHLILTLCVTVL